ncbi:hypothetical protein OsJ_33461 [Oryza sativa Japonica Group]|uniref:Uncharacterized protein n=2 Tax=Oryza sativa subsp. japonica TaxID=39947 RepID=A3CA01_ORYSJ|nr:hypothetical protein LOC_Os11g12610 [Oryza sativa Japonica Group]ABA92192.1 hypothetical protein LOC_Os11g12610 [Oryza sativa Japonica Group]EAZ17914.1 hypothetical protein OsJ_33461 [Oryza sativa Japonica Group]
MAAGRRRQGDGGGELEVGRRRRGDGGGKWRGSRASAAATSPPPDPAGGEAVAAAEPSPSPDPAAAIISFAWGNDGGGLPIGDDVGAGIAWLDASA